MNFRFVDEHDPVARHRRRLQAKRTQRFRQRQKANQAESSRIVKPVVENVQAEPEDSLLTDAGKFGLDEISSRDTFITPCQEDDDLGIIDTEPAYYDEEPVNTRAPNSADRLDY
ncbi:hypothetical protein EDB80DRAFT_691408 [Ilyonectria destructans]|nr:hypothetical protein EDB80DRAFT_691408 [Ilyonectria destructans]